MCGALGGLQIEGFRKGSLSRNKVKERIVFWCEPTVVRERFLPSLLFDVSSSSSE